MRTLSPCAALLAIGLAVGAATVPASAQEAVVATPNVDALFTDRDPRLQRNKQVVYHIMRDLLEAGHWEGKAHLYLTERYIQHNPNVPSGRASVVAFFKRIGVVPKPIPAKLSAQIVHVVAQRDIVVVTFVVTLPDTNDSTRSYTTTGLDVFRIKDGKADEHWDASPKFPMP